MNIPYRNNIKLSLFRCTSFFCLSSLILMASCTKNFADYNSDPSKATDSLLKFDYIGQGIFLPDMQKNVVITAATPGDGSTYQIAQNLCADIFSGYMASPTPFQAGRNNTNYSLVDGWTQTQFSTHLNKVMSNWLEIKNRNEKSNPAVFAIAQIIKIFSAQRVTDLYGPIPHSKYGEGGFNVAYDSQESLYYSFFLELDEAILALQKFADQFPKGKLLEKFDLVYGGDVSKWLKFANSLKLRIAMHLAYVQPSMAKQKAEEAANNPVGLITANADNATVKGIGVYNPLQVISDVYEGDICMSANMESFLTGFKDPRISKYFKPSTQYPGIFRGIRNGIDIVSKSDRQNFSRLNASLTTPIQWMTASEIHFLMAEGALRGWNMNGATAKELYERGITTSFEKEGAAGANIYIQDNTATAKAYTDPINSDYSISDGNEMLSTITIQWNENDPFEKKLERVITQKWIAIYPDGAESWTDFRRTGYPKIFPVAVNYSNGNIDTQIQIRRLPFPLSEYNNNSAEVQKAVQMLGGSGDFGGTRLWWDKKQ